eukprot:1945270-Heterocapsa_arctica.AAC.1
MGRRRRKVISLGNSRRSGWPTLRGPQGQLAADNEFYAMIRNPDPKQGGRLHVLVRAGAHTARISQAETGRVPRINAQG